MYTGTLVYPDTDRTHEEGFILAVIADSASVLKAVIRFVAMAMI